MATPAKHRSVVPIPLVVVLLGAIAYLPLLIDLGKRLWAAEHYQFFPIVLLGAGYLAIRETKDAGEFKSKKRSIGAMCLGLAAALMLLAAIFADSPWLAGISAMISIIALAAVLFGGNLTRRILPAWGFLWLAIPLPLGLDEQLIQSMQILATGWASGFLDLTGFRHVVAGVVIELPERSFLVEEACSGIHSLFSSLSLIIFYLILTKRHFFRGFLLVASAVFWVLVANSARVVAVIVLSTHWNLPVAEGIGHHLLGVAVFLMVLGMTWSTERLLLFLFPAGFKFPLLRLRRRTSRHAGKSTSQEQPTMKSARSDGRIGVAAIILSFVFVVLTGLQMAMALSKDQSPQRDSELAQLKQARKDQLPNQWNGWSLTNFESIQRDEDDPNGEFTHIWQYKKDDRLAAISIDGPFVGWHDLAGCLRGQGWKLVDSKTHSYRETNQEDMPGGFREMEVRQGLDRQAYVLYAVFDEHNLPVAPVEDYLQFRSGRRFPGAMQFFKDLTGGADDKEAKSFSTTFQIQLFADSYTKFNAQDRRELNELFHYSRQLISTFTSE